MQLSSVCKLFTMFQLFSTIIVAALVALAVSSPAPAAPPTQVKSGFEFMGTVEGKVLVSPVGQYQNLTYQDALLKCRSAGYRIATIGSKAQKDILIPYSCGTYAWTWFWIDGVSFQAPNTFFSITTGRNLSYFDWASGRPVVPAVPANICLRTSCNSAGLQMWDVPCTSKYSVVCEISA